MGWSASCLQLEERCRHKCSFSPLKTRKLTLILEVFFIECSHLIAWIGIQSAQTWRRRFKSNDRCVFSFGFQLSFACYQLRVRPRSIDDMAVLLLYCVSAECVTYLVNNSLWDLRLISQINPIQRVVNTKTKPFLSGLTFIFSSEFLNIKNLSNSLHC